MLWGWDALTVWERGILALLERRGAEPALSAVAHGARQLERWRPGGDLTLEHATRSALDAAAIEAGPHWIDIDALDSLARQAAPGGLSRHPAPSDRTAADRELVEPAWEGLGPLIVRYLAARTVANAVGYHSTSATVWAASLDTAYGVLRTEAARHAARADRVLDADLLVAAAGAADRLLVHRVDAARLAASLAALPS